VTGRFDIVFDPQEGAVTRMLGLVERRGFALKTIAMAGDSNPASLVMDVEARDPLRRFDVLARQLERLIEVRSVAVSPIPEGSPA
jgi:acetolactate synthase II small subunit